MSAYGHAAPGPGLRAPRVTLRRLADAEQFFTCAKPTCRTLATTALWVAPAGAQRLLCDEHAKPTTKQVRDGVYDVLIARTVIGRVERRRTGFDPRWDAAKTTGEHIPGFNIHSRRDAVARLIEELTR